MENSSRTLIKKGNCDFEISQDVSKKGNPYVALRLSFGGYEFPKLLFLNKVETDLIVAKIEANH